ncbi:hypothetical protein VT84_06825 [Gemmata sp. SH-PL17]|uniref:hypothetical protein n=1 Tax=Gemmata sp. SH-PL17 TaxID=1630693 RepID=UPI00078E576A|nr:hypothetical protein [Gemmata sp. SH-PL17]AMV24092.1 hypothetical protein VT84_06825 [Gemmata sp. SH-PL17]
MPASLVGEALMGLGCLTFCFALTACGGLLLALHSGLTRGLVEKLKALLAAAPKPQDGGARDI